MTSRPAPHREILEALSAHLGAGRLEASHIEALARLDRICPPEGRHPAPLRLFRCLTVGVEDHKKLQRGEDVLLAPRSHDCWSRSDLAIRMLMRIRAEQHADGAVLLLRRDFAAEDIAVDVEMLGRHLGMDCGGFCQWTNYVLPEREVIVRNAAGAVTIRPRDVMQSWHGGDLPKLFEPVIGEVFQDGMGADRVVEEYVGGDDCGNAIVRSGGVRYRMDCHSGFWHVTGATSIPDRICLDVICEFP
ncbi:hypothetical protein [Paracoccus sp. ME4]|uniref:hypothetical protein n=1 Tax=Paracoccus sp. ME4 TaxID=3138066 RepID=UPI00398B287C